MRADAEHQLVTAMLLGHDIDAAVGVRPDDFADPRAGAIWAAGWDVLDGGRPVDLISLEEALRAAERLEFVGGLEALGAYMDAPWIPERAVPDLGRAVRRRAQLRRLHQLGRELADMATAENADPDRLATEIAQRLTSTAGDAGSHRQTLADAMLERLEQARKEARGERERVRMPTGLRCLDEYLRGGIRPAWLVGLAATEKQGKTTLAQGIARATARAGYPTLVFSQEMQAIELAERDLAARAHVPIDVIEDGPRDIEWRSLISAAEAAKRERYEIIDYPLEWSEFAAEARRWRRQNRDRPGLIVIDYLQLLDIHAPKGWTREQAVSAVSRGSKRLAAELYCAVLLLAQLNDTTIASRDDKRPRASDLRESKSLNKDANVLLAVHRPWVYDMSQRPEIAEIHVLRSRHGTWPFRMNVTFAPQITAFGDPT